uniref:Uncharacterized protein n=1 Tax=Romanomermis culicivorax TaxID=13658 RepID=A0A915L8S3_ROMCU
MWMGSETELDKDHMKTEIKKLEDQMGTIARTVEHLEQVSKWKSLWIFNFEFPAHIRLEDKETIMANTKKLADINKNCKPLIIIAPDLTKQQQDERPKKNKGKNPKQK